MIGEVEILRHPVHACVPARHPVVLTVWAQGTGVLHYTWFTCGHKDGHREVREVPGATQPNLTINVETTQSFSCRVNDNKLNFKISKWAQVSVLDADRSGLPPPQWRGEPYISVQPRAQSLRPGARLRLRCAAFGVPQPTYQWYKDGQVLEQQTRETLQVTQTGAPDAGTYLCSVTNALGESWSEAVDVDLIFSKPCVEVNAAALTATDKVALLVGNLTYSHHPGLLAPVMDVHDLGLLLQQLGFRVLSLLDLTAEHMTAAVHTFIQLLDTGVYGLFYYAGHGFERSGRNYLVPIDAPQPYRTSSCLCVQRIMGKMQEKRTALSLILLDACRKWCKEESSLSMIEPLGPTGNTVYGYATGEDAEAFEVQDQSRSTGIFTKYLNKYVLLPEKVTHVLERVSEDVDRDPLVRGKQAVEIRHSLKEARSLSDPILSDGHTTELRDRDDCWRRANKLPKKKCLQFPCGAEVELGFSALFSNVLVVFANIKRSGLQATDCTVALSSNPVMENIFSGESRSEDFDSLLFGESENPESSIWLCGLQTLKESLLILVDLHFTVADGDSVRRQTQSLQLNVGKPLVSSCGLSCRTVSPNARRHRPQGAIVSPPRIQGAIVSPQRIQGAIVSPQRIQGAIVSPQGAIVSPPRIQGAIVSPQRIQGAIVSPQGAIVSPQGAIVSPQGAIVSPQGAIVSPPRIQGAIVSPQGAIVSPQRIQGAIVLPQGAIVSPQRIQGAIVSPQGAIVSPQRIQGAIVSPQGAIVSPQRIQGTQPFSRKCLEPATVGKNRPEEHDESETMDCYH